MTKVIIVISGGCLSSVYSDETIEYKLIDYDNIEAGDPIDEDFTLSDRILNSEEMDVFVDKVKEMNSKKVPKDEE